jgi:hypothetical protein
MYCADSLPTLRTHILRVVRVCRSGEWAEACAGACVLRVPHAAAAARRALFQHAATADATLASAHVCFVCHTLLQPHAAQYVNTQPPQTPH